MRPIALFPLLLILGACGGGSPTGPSTTPTPAPTPTPVAEPSPSPAPEPTPTPTPTPPPGSVVLRRATITGANGHAAGGTAEIVQAGAAFSLELRQDFRIDTGSIDVYLANQTDGVRSTDLNLGDLRSRTGAQSFALPDAGNGYRYVLLWCRPFRIPIGLGELR